MFNYAHADDLDLYTLSLYCTVSTSALEQKAVSTQQTKILNLVGHVIRDIIKYLIIFILLFACST